MASKIKTVAVERLHARTYFAKATQLCEAARAAFTDERFDATVVLAIHAGISSPDAICIGLGTRKCAESHDRAADLLEEVGAHTAAFIEHAKRRRSMLAMKNRIEYENHRATRGDPEQSIRRCEKLVGWTGNELEKAKL